MWLSELRIRLCLCSSLGPCCGVRLIPGLGNFACYECGQKKKIKNLYTMTVTINRISIVCTWANRTERDERDKLQREHK